MPSFLYTIANYFYDYFENNLYRQTFVFPNKRSGLFFKKHLSDISKNPIFSPRIITIEELFQSLSNYKISDNIELLVTLYNTSIKINRSKETFDEFVHWGEILINDFSEVDKYLIDAKQLFYNIRDLNQLDIDNSYLSQKHIDAIRTFWKNFMPFENNVTKKNFLETWEILFELYSSFKKDLKSKGIAYDGMLFRDVVENIDVSDRIGDFENIIFVGLNALTPSEHKLLSYFKNIGIADFYWDYNSDLVTDKDNKSSIWVEKNILDFPSKHILDFKNKKQKIPVHLISIPSSVGQAKQVSKIISNLYDSQYIKDPINTAIVLSQETLLLPVLYSIPESIDKINVTMGYNLSYSSVYGLIDDIARFQINIKKHNTEGEIYYYKFVLAILNHPLIVNATQDKSLEIEDIKKKIVDNNQIFINQKDLHIDQLFVDIFKSVNSPKELSEYLKKILKSISIVLNFNLEETENNINPFSIENEFVIEYYKIVTRLEDILLDSNIEVKTETFFLLLKRLTHYIKIYFKGEPLAGLQIMGVLETRAIDFDNIILLSMNEGIFPPSKELKSFIPYSLRKGFEMPTNEHYESIYAYNFYRMVSRAKRLYILHDTRSDEKQSGEVSRYFYQMKYLYKDFFDIKEYISTYQINSVSKKDQPLVIYKTPHIMEKLNQFREGGERYLSPSLINKYITCPIQFYFSAIENINEEEDIQESVESNIFGSIYHYVMEEIYKNIGGNDVSKHLISEISKNELVITKYIESGFNKFLLKKEKKEPLSGQYHIIGEIIKEYVNKTLQIDKEYAPFKFISSEYKFNKVYNVSSSLNVNFKGSIDRIDLKDNIYRIIDYKTGKGDLNFSDINSLFDNTKKKRSYQILQVLIYSLFYHLENPQNNLSLAIYYLRQLFDNQEKKEIDILKDNQKLQFISIIDEFTSQFNSCIEEIFNKDIPFTQNTEPHYCDWCSSLDL